MGNNVCFFNHIPCVELPSGTWKHLKTIQNHLEVFGSSSEFQIFPSHLEDFTWKSLGSDFGSIWKAFSNATYNFF
jgi:hypothetical protein